MNRRRAWHQRLARRMRRKTPSPGGSHSPLVLFAAITLAASLAAACAGLKTVAFVFAAAGFGTLWRELRRGAVNCAEVRREGG